MIYRVLTVLVAFGATMLNGCVATSMPMSSAFRVSPLRVTIHLPGRWVANRQSFSLPSALAGMAHSDLAISNGSEAVAIVSVPNANPSAVLGQYVAISPQPSLDVMGNTTTVSAWHEATVAGFTAVAQDFATRAGNGRISLTGTFYVVNAGTEVVFVRIAAAGGHARGLGAIEQAVTSPVGDPTA